MDTKSNYVDSCNFLYS